MDNLLVSSDKWALISLWSHFLGAYALTMLYLDSLSLPCSTLLGQDAIDF